MSETDDVEKTVHEFITTQFLQGNDGDLNADTRLMDTGILNSISTVKLIAFLESKFRIRVLPNDIEQDNLGSLAAITRFVERKRKPK